MRTRILLLAATLAFFGCAPTHYVYAPVRTMSAELEGAPAALIEIPPDSPRGDVRVAMMGIATLRAGRLEDASIRAVHVALAASNRSSEHWTVDASEQRFLLDMDGERDDIYATTADVARPQTVDVPPRSVRYVELYFPLPYRLQKADALPSFDVLWTVRTASLVVSQRTAFQRFLATPPSSTESNERDSEWPRSETPLHKYLRPLDDD